MVENQESLIMKELVRRSNRESRRLRVVEQKLDSLESRLNSLEQREFNHQKDIKEKLAVFESRLKTMETEMIKVKNFIEKIFEKFEKAATKRDVKELEIMFDLLNPISQKFVTRDELDKKLGLK